MGGDPHHPDPANRPEKRVTRRAPAERPSSSAMPPAARPNARVTRRKPQPPRPSSSVQEAAAEASATIQLPASHGTEIPPEVAFAAEQVRRQSSTPPLSRSGRPSSEVRSGTDRKAKGKKKSARKRNENLDHGASPVAIRLGLREPAAPKVNVPDEIDVARLESNAEGIWNQLDEFAEVGDDEKYKLLGEIGRGSMGAILRGFDRDVRREIAMKVMLEQRPTAGQLSRFLEEGQITGQLEHPNVPPVHEIGLDAKGRLYFSMKLVRGRSLHDRLQDVLDDLDHSDHGQKRFPLHARLDVFRKICDAISFAHSRGVLHRDLKPENIMVGQFGEVQVMDWGLAKLLGRTEEVDDDDDDQVLVTSDRVEEGAIRTMQGAVAGTPAYMAPEQARGENATLDERADVYALGAILYELLVFHPPYDGDSLIEVLNQVKAGALVTPTDRLRKWPQLRAAGVVVPVELEAVVLRAMEPESRRRYRTVRELKADIDAWLANEPVSAHRDTALERIIKWGRRHPTRALGSAAAVLLVLITGLVFSVMWAMYSDAQRQADTIALEKAESDRKQAEETAKVAKLQADNAEKAAVLERERASRSEAERAKMRAEQDQERAEQERKNAEMRELVARGELDDLQKLLGATINRQRDEAFEAFRKAYTTALASGKTQEQFISDLGRDKIEEWIEVMMRAMDAADRLQTVTIDSGDMFRLGVLYQFGTREYPTADYYYSKAIELDPIGVEPLLQRASVRDLMGRPEDALADYDRAVEMAGQSPVALVARGEFHRRHGRVQPAVDDFDAAAALRPGDADATLRKGWLLINAGMLDQAMTEFNAVLAAAPDNTAALAGRGAVKRLRGDLDGSMTDLNLAVQQDANYHRARVSRGQTWMEMGRVDKAMEDFDHVLEQVPDNPDALWCRAGARRRINDSRGAIDDYSALLAANPDNAAALTARGEARMQVDAELALADLQRATELEPTRWRAWASLGQVLILFNRRNDAADALEKAWRLCPDENTRTQLATTMFQVAQRWPKAEDDR